MSTGKYSPLCPHAHESGWEAYRFNCYSETPAPWNKELADAGVKYDEKSMYDNYDDEGFDSYGLMPMATTLGSVTVLIVTATLKMIT